MGVDLAKLSDAATTMVTMSLAAGFGDGSLNGKSTRKVPNYLTDGDHNVLEVNKSMYTL